MPPRPMLLPPRAGAPYPTALATLNSEKDLSLFTKLADISGLRPYLDSTYTRATIFAPSNAAITALAAALKIKPEDLALPRNQLLVDRLVGYHVITKSGNLAAKSLTSGEVLHTVGGGNVSVSIAGKTNRRRLIEKPSAVNATKALVNATANATASATANATAKANRTGPAVVSASALKVAAKLATGRRLHATKPGAVNATKALVNTTANATAKATAKANLTSPAVKSASAIKVAAKVAAASPSAVFNTTARLPGLLSGAPSLGRLGHRHLLARPKPSARNATKARAKASANATANAIADATADATDSATANATANATDSATANATANATATANRTGPVVMSASAIKIAAKVAAASPSAVFNTTARLPGLLSGAPSLGRLGGRHLLARPRPSARNATKALAKATAKARARANATANANANATAKASANGTAKANQTAPAVKSASAIKVAAKLATAAPKPKPDVGRHLLSSFLRMLHAEPAKKASPSPAPAKKAGTSPAPAKKAGTSPAPAKKAAASPPAAAKPATSAPAPKPAAPSGPIVTIKGVQNSAKVIGTDLVGGNVTIHVIDNVLLPATVFKTIKDALAFSPSVSALSVLAADDTVLKKAFADPTTNITLFAPTTKAREGSALGPAPPPPPALLPHHGGSIEDVANGAVTGKLLQTKDSVSKILQYHAVKGARLEPSFTGQGTVKLPTLLAGHSVQLSKVITPATDSTEATGVIQVLADSEGAQPHIVKKHNIIAGASYVNVIDGVLIPKI
ncbi:hypothetical protein MNEG_9039 [Monoraphidium neglectum]|uniref:FAS1 domain-containing protein n=1 Tax=Monoraphidium neglectum TaxID=145388 RepID=A0A0D2M654_9CHLO|nr:hypothetical protein MNEG_9039 [Monoraphidium neglectum]KIY98924.1 hypothetical protein MNEG_9039 [Monoraphidium neglectum]|eukprot:XP_013897944.1 hypothetical protein MNEG_9039 [Monoraphidium neglectum]